MTVNPQALTHFQRTNKALITHIFLLTSKKEGW